MSDRVQLDFEGDPLKLVDAAYQLAKTHQTVLNNQCGRDYLMYRSYVDMTYRDNTLPNISLPKIFSIIEIKTPEYVRVLLGSRPYIPIDTPKRPEYKMIAESQQDIVDDYLERGNFFLKSTLGFKLKTLYGTSFMDAVPFYEDAITRIAIPGPMGIEIKEIPWKRLKFHLKVWAPWDIYPDPYATGLEETEDCRYVIKIQLVDKRELIKMALSGAYPNYDIERLYASPHSLSAAGEDNEGYKILREFGLDSPQGDDNMGLLMRYESPDRYTDIWNGLDVLRDGDNPFSKKYRGHGGINLARIVHVQDAHTQNQFWGIGEAKPNEVQAAMLNDLWNSVFRREQIAGEPLVFYRKDDVDPDSLIWTSGNRVPVSGDRARPIRDSIDIYGGQNMPADQFNLLQMVERNMDMVASSFASNRGETSRMGTTATEIMQIKESGSATQELSVRLGEMIFLKKFGEMMFCNIDQFATMQDIAEIIGQERASVLISANPKDIPGGYDFKFKGSNRVSNVLIKQRNLKEVFPVLNNLLGTGQFVMAKVLMESFEMSTTEIQEILQENLQLMQFKAAQMASEAEARAAQSGKDNGNKGGKPGGKYKVNDNQQLALENAAAMSER